MMDFLSEFCSERGGEFLSGTYYKRKPLTAGDSGAEFTYEIIDRKSREYKTLIGTLWAEGAEFSIKTRAYIKFKPKQYVVTQDGRLWQIAAVYVNPQTEQGKDALRLFKDTANTERVLRLTGVENTMGLK